MNKMKLLAGALLLSAISMPVCAQNRTKHDSHYFVQGMGGIQLPFTPGSRTKLIQPNFGLNVGRWFIPDVGVRIGAEGLSSKVKYMDKYEKFNYLNFDADIMVNLLPLFSKRSKSGHRLYVLGGLGLNVVTDKGAMADVSLSDFGHNLRVGMGFDYKLSKPLTVSLEYRLNNTADYFNGLENNSTDWFSSLLLGVSFNFGHKTYKVPAIPAVQTMAKPMSLYEQMQAGVNERMNTWMRRLKGESKADYLARTSEETIEAKRLEFTKEISTQMAGNRSNTNKEDLLYNTDSQLLGVVFTDMPIITLNVPLSEINSFKTINDINFTNTIYNLNPDDSFEILYTESINPATGKTYSYVQTEDNKYVDTKGFLPIAAIHQSMQNDIRLQETAKKIIQEAKEQNILSDHTTITVTSKLVPTERGKADYHINYRYTVDDEFSAQDDFAPGKYDAEASNASAAMLKIINESLNGEFAEYMKAHKTVHINYHGSADSKPIKSRIMYDGKYGDINNQTVTINGKPETITITTSDPIKTNEQLSLLRAISVRDFIHKNVVKLNNMKTTDTYSVGVAQEDGAQYRRVSVTFVFHDIAF